MNIAKLTRIFQITDHNTFYILKTYQDFHIRYNSITLQRTILIIETMKKIIVTLLCAAVMISCGGSKEKTNECSGNHAECTHQHDDCNGNHEGYGGCEGHSHEAKAGCIKIDTDGFVKKVADFNQAEWKYLGDKPAIVDFYADWCGPCKEIAPTLEDIAKEYDGKLYVYKVNVDEASEIANAFGIKAIPTLLFIPMQGEPKTEVGMKTKEELEKIIKESLLK